MIHIPDINQQYYYIYGLGKSGLAAALAFKKSGAIVCAWDENDSLRLEALNLGISIAAPDKINWFQQKALVLSPGIPHTFPNPHPVAVQALNAGIPILCDVEFLFHAEQKSTLIGITGTNGKSTTTALITHILKCLNYPVQEGGNIGIPALSLTPSLNDDQIYAIELSSFQLERILTPALDISILMNITNNHLERHGGWDGYQLAKEKIFDLMKPDSKISKKIIGIDSERTSQLYHQYRSDNTIPISGQQKVEKGIYAKDTVLWDDYYQSYTKIMDLSGIRSLRGNHNYQNIAAAYAAVQAILQDHSKDTINAIVSAIRSYPGLPHRQEWVGQRGLLTFINDSKATTIEAAAKSIAQFENIFWIMGGKAKSGWDDISALMPYISRLKKVFLIGDSAKDYEKILSPHIPCYQAGTIENAIKLVIQESHYSPQEKVVLLAPACASYDQFKDFEERGNVFKKIVQHLAFNLSTDIKSNLQSD